MSDFLSRAPGTVVREAQLSWKPTRTRAEAEERKRTLESRSRKGPPLFVCHGCGKIAEGTWNGQREHPPQSEASRQRFECLAIPWAPGGWTATILTDVNGARVGMLGICSQECLLAHYPEESEFK